MAYGIGQAIGGFASGLASGMKTASDIEDAKQRRALNEKASAREDERFKMEKEKMDDERSKLAARKEFAQTLAQIQSDATSGANGFEQFGYTAAPVSQNPVGAISGPDGQPGRADIAGPPTAPVQQQQAAPNIFKATADGMYQNQRGADQLIAQRRAQALENLYTKLGEPEKAMTAKSMMTELFDKDVERKTKTALAAAAIGAPGAMDAFAKVYHYMSDGKDINPQSGQFDPSSGTWKGVEFIDTKTGRTQSMDITQQMILGLAKQDVTALVPFNIEQADKARKAGLEERKVKVDEGTLGVHQDDSQTKKEALKADNKRADADMIRANAQQSRATALNNREAQDAKGTDQKAKVEAAAKMFPSVSMDPAKKLMLSKPEKEAAAKDEVMFKKTLELSGLNPHVPMATLGAVVRQAMQAKGQADAQRDADGRAFTVVSGTKVYLN